MPTAETARSGHSAANMANLPESWGLKTQPRADGKLDIIGTTDAGDSYRVRTTEGSEVTDKDVKELKDADRESYSNSPNRTQEAMRRMFGDLTPHKPSQQELIHSALNFDESDWIEAAEPIVHAGFERRGSTTGSTRAFRRGWEYAFGKEN